MADAGDASASAGAIPRAADRFFRAHGLGNDYLVVRAAREGELSWPVNPATVRAVCDRHEGIGADGIVVALESRPADGVFPLRMFNPDGSEFERSGNGLRILAAWLHREGHVGEDSFRVRSGGDVISMRVHGVDGEGRYDVSVEMGRARVGLDPVEASPGALGAGGVAEHAELGPVPFVPVSVGNPHAVVFPEEMEGPSTGREAPLGEAGDALLARIGPFLTTHPAFRAGTNVQLARVEGPGVLRIWIWERGVGRTSASGTSSCAVAVAAVHSGRVAPGPIRVRMDGGELQVSVDRELGVVLRGPVEAIAEGRMAPGWRERLERLPDGVRSAPVS